MLTATRLPGPHVMRIFAAAIPMALCMLTGSAHAQQPESRPAGPTPSGQPGTPPAPTPPAPEKPWAKGVPPEKRAEALKWFRKGNEYFAQSQYIQALAEYRKAIRHWQHPAIHYNMAVCLINQTNQQIAAWHMLNKALKYGQGPLSPKTYAQAKTYRNLLRGQLAFVRVSCKEPGAEVTLDGKFLFKAPGEKKKVILPGSHVLVASKEGFMTFKKTVQVFPGKDTVFTVKLLPVEEAVKTKRRWKRYMPWTVFGSGVGVALIGVGLILKARSDFEDHKTRFSAQCGDGCEDPDDPLTSTPPVPNSLKKLEKRAYAEYYSSIVLLAAGGATIASGIVLLVLNIPRRVRVEREDTGSKGPKSFSIFPVVGPNGGMVVTGFRF